MRHDEFTHVRVCACECPVGNGPVFERVRVSVCMYMCVSVRDTYRERDRECVCMPTQITYTCGAGEHK